MTTDISIGDGERGAILGMTGTGKSTLVAELKARWRKANRNGLAVTIDSKPRFRATHALNGTALGYKHWAEGDTIPQSIAVYSLADARHAALLSNELIYQSMRPDGSAVEQYEAGAAEIAEWLFRKSGRNRHTLFVVDEYYDLLRGPAGIADRRILRTIRAGRERYMTVLTGSQRPRSIPLSTLTEATNFYIFQLEFEEDWKYLQKHAVPIAELPEGYEFIFYRRERGGKRIVERAVLNVQTKAA